MRKMLFGSAIVAMLAGGCGNASPQTFCVQFANTTGFGDEGINVTFEATDARGRAVVFTATDANGDPVSGTTFSLSNPRDAGDSFASGLITVSGVPPVSFSAPIQLGQDTSCTAPPIFGIGVTPNIANRLFRVEATSAGTLECAEDQGSCN